jgi:hypothetical protein
MPYVCGEKLVKDERRSLSLVGWQIFYLHVANKTFPGSIVNVHTDRGSSVLFGHSSEFLLYYLRD